MDFTRRLSSLNVAAATVAVLLAFMALAVVQDQVNPQFRNPNATLVEAPLAKNAQFQLVPGERYVYGTVSDETPINVTYAILSGRNCTIIAFMNTVPASSTCVGTDGRDSGGHDSQLDSPNVFMFAPWMLALQEGWHWNVSMYMSFGNSSRYIATKDYRVMRTDRWRGRKVFVVMENISGSPPQYEWVDAEKRVLLRLQGEGYAIELVEGLPLTGMDDSGTGPATDGIAPAADGTAAANWTAAEN